jgi:hypothetical protein
MPAVKWFPLYWPNAEWEVIQLPNLRQRPTLPDGAIIPWWKMPKDQWPIEAPWAPKIFGAWPASKITMSEDLTPGIWPGGDHAPPFGFIKIKMPGTPDVSGYQGPKGNQIPFTNMKIHMRPELGPIHHMKIMTRINALGETKFYMIDKNWEQHEYDHKQYRAALKARKQERFMRMLAEEIIRTKAEPKPTPDLFS